jgi:hypothetical protein
MANTSIMLAVGVIAAAAIGLIDEGDQLPGTGATRMRPEFRSPAPTP